MMKNTTLAISKNFHKTFQKMPQLGALAILIAASTVFGIFSPVNNGVNVFLSWKNIGNVIEQTAAISMCAFGMTMILQIGGIDLSAGSVVGLTGMVCCKLMTDAGWGMVPAICAIFAIGILAGFLNGCLIVLFDIQPFLVSLSTQTVLRGVVYAISHGNTISLPSKTMRNIFCRGRLLGIPVTAVWTIAVMLIMWVIASRSRFGRNCQAIGGNENAARNSGINVARVKIKTYTLAGALFALAGAITLARLGSGNAMTGLGAEGNAIAAAIIGGSSFTGDGGNMFGTLLGSLVMGVFVNGLTLLGVDSYYQDIVKGLIIILAVIGSNYLIQDKKR